MKKTILFIACLFVFGSGAFAQVPSYQVFALRYASMKDATPTEVWSLNAPKTDSVHIDFVVWLIKGSNGKNILVDAGFLRDIPEAKEFVPVNYIRPDSALLKIGVKPEDITDIILSHPHWDHIDGIGLFPNAHIWIQKDDFGFFVGDAWQKDPTNNGFNKRDVIKMVELNMAGKVTLVDGDDKELFPGIRVYTGSRHTFNSQYVQIKTENDRIVLASDNIWVYYSLEHMVPASVGGTFDPTGYVKAMQRMKTLASDIKYIVPGHDHQMFSRFPAVTDGVARIK